MSTKIVYRAEVYFTGNVQGVGFRYTTADIAQGFEVTGTVQNLPDGRVYLIAEGAEVEVNRFIEAIRAQMRHYIAQTGIETEKRPQEFKDFKIVK